MPAKIMIRAVGTPWHSNRDVPPRKPPSPPPYLEPFQFGWDIMLQNVSKENIWFEHCMGDVGGYQKFLRKIVEP